jgi:hypothetical protein
MGYNGFSNRETWLVHLWIANDEYLMVSVIEAENSRELQEFFQENSPVSTGLYADLLNHALSCVEWDEVFDAIPRRE